MPIYIYEHQGVISSPDLGRYLKDRTGRSGLRSLVRGWVGSAIQAPVTSLPTPNLQRYVDRYAEQGIVDPVADLKKFFATLQALGFTPGGVATGLPPLAILPGYLRPSISAISAVAEALAGWYLETVKNMTALARPIGEGPDLIFTDRQTGANALVQVKGTQEPDVQGRLIDGALSLLSYISNVKHMAPAAAFACHVIGIVIKTGSDYQLVNLQVDLP